jgi:hypothetical protein
MDRTDDFLDSMRLLTVLLVGTCVVIFGLYSWLHPQPPLARSYADGVYRNTQCGVVKLQGGTATFEGANAPYTLERGKSGILALPPHFLGVRTGDTGCKVTYDQSKFSLYISLGRDDPPKAITLWDVDRLVTYDFVRD